MTFLLLLERERGDSGVNHVSRNTQTSISNLCTSGSLSNKLYKGSGIFSLI